MKNKSLKIASFIFTIILISIVLVPKNTRAAVNINKIEELDASEVDEEKLEKSEVCDNMYSSALKNMIKVDTKAKTIKNTSSNVHWVIKWISYQQVNVALDPGKSYTVRDADYGADDEVTGLNSAILQLTLAKDYLFINDECYVTDVGKRVSFGNGQSKIMGESTCSNAITDTTYYQEEVKSLDCSRTKNEFEVAFCATKAAAEATGHTYNMNTSSFSNQAATFTGTRFKDDYVISGLKCESDVNNTAKVPLDPTTLVGDAYFVNSQSYYAEHTQELKTTYKYYYAPGRNGQAVATNGATVSCKRVCSEAVSVEYGPPVAKKAGMSFEYRVRVTSRVDCHAKTGEDFPDPPKCDCTYCSPAPSCAHDSGDEVWYGPQAGPKASYESCIKKCDGGKYTKKCSDKCYKKVYGTKTTNTLGTTSTQNKEVVADKTAAEYGSLSHCKSLSENFRGCYYRDGRGIDWSDNNPNNPGRWYWENNMTHNNACDEPGDFCPDEHGFRRKIFESGSICAADCEWVVSSCRSDQYLNPGYGYNDCEKNNQRWLDLIKSCNEQATCNTTTSYYTIDAGYNDETIIFPKGATDKVTDSSDKLKGGETPTAANNAKSTLLPDFPEPKSEHNGIQGCYNDDKSGNDPIPNRLYKATWGFPNTWMNAKTGEISYTSQDGQKGWAKYTKKYVIPFDQKSVNSEWWNLFYNKHLDELGNISIKQTDVQSQCIGEGGNTILTPNPGATVSKWNINAHVRSFGWFKWNFDIACFFATNKKPTYSKINDNYIQNTKCDPDKDNVRVRSIDLEDLFPNKDGSSHSLDTAGRTTGFNWSQYAIQQKNEGYQSNPPKIISYIQNTGYKIYDESAYADKYLDYKFVLTPTDLRRLRGDNSANAGNYTDFNEDGFYMDANGVIRYFSEKIRDAHITDKIVPDKDVLVCNNIGDYRQGCNTEVE